MPNAQPRKLFVNLAVRDVKRSMEFFTRLGFEFDPKFTDEKAACMIIGPDAFVMLLAASFFETFTKKQICDTRTHTEGLFALSCESRAEVDAMVKKAIELGGQPASEAQDHGFMYFDTFYDLDGHHWEVLWWNPDAN